MFNCHWDINIYKYTNNNKGPSTDPFGMPYNILRKTKKLP